MSTRPNYYLDKNDFRSAEKYSDVLTDQCPNDENILYATSKIKTNLRKYSEGFELLSRIVSINPMNSNAYFDQSWLLYNNGQYEDAIGYFKHTLEIDPTKYYSYFFIADSYHKTKKYKEAINYYMKFIMIAKDKNGVDQRYLDWAEERIKELLKLTG